MLQGFWTSTRVDELRQLWADGYSAAQCAVAMGVSRSAIVGKVTRLGISHSHNPDYEPKSSSEKKMRKPHPGSPPNQRFDLPEDSKIPADQRRSIYELNNYSCRWPVGDPLSSAFFYCGASGANLEDDRPYCEWHTKRAHQLPYWQRLSTRASSSSPWHQPQM